MECVSYFSSLAPLMCFYVIFRVFMIPEVSVCNGFQRGIKGVLYGYKRKVFVG